MFLTKAQTQITSEWGVVLRTCNPSTWEVCKQEAQEVRAVLGYRKSETSLGHTKPWRENLNVYRPMKEGFLAVTNCDSGHPMWTLPQPRKGKSWQYPVS